MGLRRKIYCLTALVAIGAASYFYNQIERTYSGTVVKKDRLNSEVQIDQNNGSKPILQDTWSVWQMKFGSNGYLDQMEEGKTYQIKTRGSNIWIMKPNIQSIEEVSSIKNRYETDFLEGILNSYDTMPEGDERTMTRIKEGYDAAVEGIDSATEKAKAVKDWYDELPSEDKEIFEKYINDAKDSITE